MKNVTYIAISVLTATLYANNLNACTLPDPPIIIAVNSSNDVKEGATFALDVTGLIASGALPGNSCAIAVSLANGVDVKAVDVVNATTGESIGFGEFQRDNNAAKHLCDDGDQACSAFVSVIDKGGVQRGVPIKFAIWAHAGSAEFVRNNLVKIASGVGRSMTLVAGRVDSSGKPEHHLIAIRPTIIDVKFDE